MSQLEMLRAVFSPAQMEKINATVRDFVKQMEKLSATINQAGGVGPRWRRLLGLPLRDEHHPPKLSIDGAAYHRRRNSRRRRR